MQSVRHLRAGDVVLREFTEADVPGLVAGTLKQQRILAASPRPVGEDDVARILQGSLRLW